MTANHTASGERIKTFIQTWAGRDGPLYTNEVADICFEVDALVAAVTELQQLAEKDPKNGVEWMLVVKDERVRADAAVRRADANAAEAADLERRLAEQERNQDAAVRRAEQAEEERDIAIRTSQMNADAHVAAEARADTLTRALLSGDSMETRFTVVRDPQGVWLWRHDALKGGGFRSERVAALAAGDGTTPTTGSTDDDTENFGAVVDEARSILATGDRLAAIAFLTGRTREEVERVCGTTPTGADE